MAIKPSSWRTDGPEKKDPAAALAVIRIDLQDAQGRCLRVHSEASQSGHLSVRSQEIVDATDASLDSGSLWVVIAGIAIKRNNRGQPRVNVGGQHIMIPVSLPETRYALSRLSLGGIC